MEGSVCETTLGVSRTNWRVADCYWLTRCESERANAFRRECHLLHAVAEVTRTEAALSLVVPTVVPTRSGDLVAVHDGSLWRLTRHVDGIHPSANDPATYDLMLDAIFRLHRAFDLISNLWPAYPNTLCRVRRHLGQLSSTITPTTSLARETEVLCRAATWIEPRLHRLSKIPARLVHGDWTPVNVLIRSDKSVGILDFESCGLGPAVLDFANMCSTLLMWSRLDNISQRIAALASSIEKSTGSAVGLENICISMVTHWIGHYLDWRDRPSTAKNTEVLHRLLGRIETTLNFAAGTVP